VVAIAAAATHATPIGVAPAAPVVKIGFYTGNGTSRTVHSGVDATTGFYTVLKAAATTAFGGPASFTIANMSGPDVQHITPAMYDVVVFPGGSGSGQSTAVGLAGLAALREFVAAGKGYIGTCGGAFLGLQHVRFYGHGPKGLGPPTQEPWDRGHGVVQVVLVL